MATAARGASVRRQRAVKRERRGTANQRGYDAQWRRLAALHRVAHPLCEHCLRVGVVNAGGSRRLIVDHVIPFQGFDDPLRLDPRNLQSLCHKHHQQKTARDQRLQS